MLINDLKNYINSFNDSGIGTERTDNQIEEWNLFISKLNISNDDKKYYNINI